MVAQVRQQEEADRCAKAVSQSKQGQWTSWENLEHRKLTWKDLWEMEGSQISFIIRATYDVLPTPKNLNQWFREDPSCALCQTPATLRHILTGCKTSLSQGRYTWSLEAQPGPKTTSDHPGRKEDYQQHSPSPNALALKDHPLSKSRLQKYLHAYLHSVQLHEGKVEMHTSLQMQM